MHDILRMITGTTVGIAVYYGMIAIGVLFSVSLATSMLATLSVTAAMAHKP